VKGHEPLVSETLYNDVQDVLDGRKRGEYRLKIAANATMPLRGFLICPMCSKILTGSASKGRGRYYSYYHCFKGCTCRFKTDDVNRAFELELLKYVPAAEMSNLSKVVIEEAWYDETSHIQTERKSLTSQIKDLEGRLSHARDLLGGQQLDPQDFKAMKTDYIARIEKLEARLADCADDSTGIEDLLSTGVDKLLRLDNAYKEATTEIKRDIIGSIYPEKLTYDGTGVRTTRINEAVQMIYLINRGLDIKKDKGNLRISTLSNHVEVAGFEPTCNQLSFLHCIRVREYTSRCSGSGIRTTHLLSQNQPSCR
jgi:site-specific DNA recombinase